MPKRAPQDVLRTYLTQDPVDRAIAQFVKRMRTSGQSESASIKKLLTLALLTLHGADARQFIETLFPAGAHIANDAAKDLDALAMLRKLQDRVDSPSSPPRSTPKSVALENHPAMPTNAAAKPFSSQTMGEGLNAIDARSERIDATSSPPIAGSNGNDLKSKWRAMAMSQLVAAPASESS